MFMFGFVICVSESVVVIFGCKIDYLFIYYFYFMIGSYWPTAID